MSGGTIGVIAGDLSRYTFFSVALSNLGAPEGTVIDWGVGGDRAANRNGIIERALERNSDWVFMVDDDHIFNSKLLLQLLSRNVLNGVVAALYLQRTEPFSPIAFDRRNSEGVYEPVDLAVHGGEDLIVVAAAGSGGMLIPRNVYGALEPPWFEHSTNKSEDIFFCERVGEELNLPIYLDVAARMGHLAPSAIWPVYTSGVGWEAAFTFSEGNVARRTIPRLYEES